ncbi:acetylornithine deacetylase/succinyl-diaminopimelate desuccinylase family protein [Emcibacteraceae bacterium]|uniref:acetylornithine deacetylase/succinyl-diaminopimelate desuccinylase family protein n=1 Tax=Pseudemcibacter sp. TaxID=2943293 RepID=UPI00230CE6DE|nr:acetylornithine deacetylase/succinyl-diaminopimelate desuccinylase family protein [Emcibacteraceae bacterium]MDA9771100.1 acetylornithine deacetylase/succinyl-diaminopimelate desuccinylase family protein [Emcibacteraceae bacterium]
MSEQILSGVFEEIEKQEKSLVRLCQDLIRFPTINPPGNDYQAIVEYIGNRLKNRGFSIEYVRAYGAPGDSADYPRYNVIARYETGRHGPCVHFNSHIDVVETGDGWTKDPFAAELIDGKIYGRGACDMKGGLAASIIAAEALISSDIELKGAIEISGTADEESGGLGGVAYLAEKGYFSKDRVDHVIIPEPLNVDRVCLGHRGVWWAEIETHGRIAHGSMPFLGDCAVRHMGAVVAEFEDKLYPAMAARFTEMPVVPEGAKQSTLNINSIHGGQEEGSDGLPSPCVPDSCRMIIDRRFLVEEDLKEVKGEVTTILNGLKTSREGFKYEIRDMLEVIPSMTDINSPVVQETANAIKDVLGKDPDFICSPGTYDQKHIDRIGNLKDCIAYGPGILELAHQPDEYVEVDDMVNSAKVMAQAAYNLLMK